VSCKGRSLKKVGKHWSKETQFEISANLKLFLLSFELMETMVIFTPSVMIRSNMNYSVHIQVSSDGSKVEEWFKW
jgi:nucleosome binding factor SPN SPT16 subunit